jgi:hypothetical protein
MITEIPGLAGSEQDANIATNTQAIRERLPQR